MVHTIILRNIADASDAFTYVKPYIKKDDGRYYIQALRSRYENVAIQEQYVSKAKRTIETIQYGKNGNDVQMFCQQARQSCQRTRKLGRDMHRYEIVEIIWQRVRNAELIQYLTTLRVQFQHQLRNYREVLQYMQVRWRP